MFNTYGQEHQTFDFDTAQSYDQEPAEDDYETEQYNEPQVYEQPQDYELDSQSYAQPALEQSYSMQDPEPVYSEPPLDLSAAKEETETPQVDYHDLLVNRYETRSPGHGDEQLNDYPEEDNSRGYDDEELDDYRQEEQGQGYDDQQLPLDYYDLGYNKGFSEGYYAPHPGMGYGAVDPYAPRLQR